MAIKTGVYTNCEFCGKEIYKTLSKYKKHKHHFCSNKCQSAYNNIDKFEYRKCEICGNEFYTSKVSKQRFCSNKCQNEWQKTRTGFLNKKFEGGYVKCENCGKSFIVGKNILDDKRHHFCSNKCRQEWYSNVYSQSPEWKEESRKRAVKLLKENKATVNTKPQQIVNKMLEDLSINYRNEEPFVYYSIDNYLPDFNLAIEVMGDYWHNNPLKYDHIVKNRNITISRDKAKHTYIKNYHGFEILYLWESDIIKNQNLCSALITLYIKNKGSLSNYNSFNYHLTENNIVQLNNVIIYPYQEKIAC